MHFSMFGLRQKLLLGFGGLLSLLLMVAALAIAVTLVSRKTLDQFLTENWRSVDYGQKMVDAVDHLDDLVRKGSLPATGAWVKQFNTNLDAENRNITLKGEQEDVDNLTLHWAGVDRLGRHYSPAYQPALTMLLNPASTAADRVTATAALNASSPLVKADAQAVIKLNFDNLSPLSESVTAKADHTTRWMFLLTFAGAALAVLFVIFMSRSILQPLQMLTRSAKEIEQGNLDLVVQVNSHDELHQLAEAFNSMAAKLREYRRTNRAKLIRTQATTQLAINSLPDVVAIIRPDGHVEMANTSARNLFGLRADAHVSELKVPWLADLYRKTSTTLLPVEPRGYESAVQVLENGGERFFLPHATPILDEDRILIGVTIVLADVTNLRRLDEMKSGMLAVVSHELKTPLTSIRMGVHLLLEERLGDLTGNQTEILLAIREDSNRLHQIIENLLDMGQMESGRGVMDLQPRHLEEIIRDTAGPMESAFRDRGLHLEIALASDLPKVLVDPARIGHVFSNLLGNALKYTPPGGEVRVTGKMGVPPVVETNDHGRGVLATAGQVEISIQDTGPGIPPQHIDRIFERFFRVPGQSGASGAGLGLAIAKEIVELHGGRLTVQSMQGHGAKFTFTLTAAADRQLSHARQDSQELTATAGIA
jgi:NtrC-family two-component system sensor histidine kinase KinB